MEDSVTESSNRCRESQRKLVFCRARGGLFEITRLTKTARAQG